MTATRPPIGTYAWCMRSNGQLNRREKLQVVGMLVQAQFRNLIEAGMTRLPGFHNFYARINLDRVVFPDSQIARAAEDYAEQQYLNPLRLHCYRTYMWAALLGQIDGRVYDAELLFVASLLHDLGLTAAHLRHAQTCCFAMNGARYAYDFVMTQGWPHERAVRTYEAISLHLNPIVDARVHGAETQLVGDGATMDVIGSRRHCLPEAIIQAVQARFPRHGFREEILHTIRVPHATNSRPAFLAKGFEFFAARNMLDTPRYAGTTKDQVEYE